MILRPRRLRWLLLPLVLLVIVWSRFIEPRRLVVHETAIDLPSLPLAFESLRVAALSDLHLGGPHVGIERLRTVVARANAEHPDAVVLLGDFLGDGPVAPDDPLLQQASTVLAELKAPLGVFAVLGNHDWWYGADAATRMLERAGLILLDERTFALRRGDAALWLLGIPDLTTRRPHPAQLLERAGLPAETCVVALTHDPTVFPDVPTRVALTLAGHTHGGQVRLPLIGAPIVPSRYGQRYVRGLIEEAGHALFVTTGIGTSMIPVRLGVPPELAILTLRSR